MQSCGEGEMSKGDGKEKLVTLKKYGTTNSLWVHFLGKGEVSKCVQLGCLKFDGTSS